MHHIAFHKLVSGGIDNLAAGNGRVYRQDGQHILKLVSEAKRSAGLVKTRATPDAAGESLVEHPAVEDQVGSWFRGMHLYSVKQLIPEQTGCVCRLPLRRRDYGISWPMRGRVLYYLPGRERSKFLRSHREAGPGVIAGRRKDLRRGVMRVSSPKRRRAAVGKAGVPPRPRNSVRSAVRA